MRKLTFTNSLEGQAQHRLRETLLKRLQDAGVHKDSIVKIFSAIDQIAFNRRFDVLKVLAAVEETHALQMQEQRLQEIEKMYSEQIFLLSMPLAILTKNMSDEEFKNIVPDGFNDDEVIKRFIIRKLK